MKKYKGRIVDVYKAKGGFRRIVSGIRKDKQPLYDKTFRGSNGTYLASDNTYPVIYVKVIVYDLDNIPIEIDIRDIILNHYKLERISPQRILGVKNKLVGKKITIIERMWTTMK